MRWALAFEPPAAPGERMPWTTSRIQGSPEPPLPYVTERAFPALKFDQCLDLAVPPGGERLFVVEQKGKIYSFPNRPDVAQADLVVDLAQAIPGVDQVYALAFHPDFQRNRYLYVCYIKAANLDDGTHIARFELSDTDPPVIDVATEHTIITWLSGGHNGCCLKFGPDGYLYISTGDGVGPNPPDTRQTGQDITDLLSSILRIDVDHSDEERNYRIPPDNPFVELAGARGEVWAYGLRNPWRMSFDRRTGDLWVGDVGWELWELLVRVERGGNYGWAVMEGRQPTNPEWPRGPTAILPPTIDHPHSESSSITDGLTYYGTRLPELQGTHVYADYDTGKFWGFRYVDGRVVEHREIADTTHRVVGFGEDAAGEFYILDHTAGTLHRLIPNPRSGSPADFPRRLSASGLFSSVAEHSPAPGVIPYQINAAAWADGATADRWLGIPHRGSIQTTGANWTYPIDTVFAKTLWLEMESGHPASRLRVETQILHFDGQDWQPYTYQWNQEQTDAELVDSAGTESVFAIRDASQPSGTRRQTWRFSGRAECQRCHNRWSGPPLAFNPPQLHVQLDQNSESPSQLAALAQWQVLAKPVATNNLASLVDPHDPQADLDRRARSYLHTNCAHCHRMHAGGAVLSKMQFDLPLEQTSLLGERPTQGTFGIFAAEVVAPGEPYRSVLLYRMSKLGGGRMPHLGSTEIDRAGVRLIHDWVASLPRTATATSDVIANLRDQEAAALRSLNEAANAADQASHLAQLLTSTSGALRLAHAVEREQLPAPVAEAAIQQAAQHAEVSVRDLFEPFLPTEQRVKRLGAVIDPAQILSLEGDIERGRQVYFNTAGVQCKSCHRIQQIGNEVGPDLTTIGQKLDRPRMLESILEPSKRIEPKYVTYLAELDDGRIVTGLLVHQDEREIVLKNAQNVEVRLPAASVDTLAAQGLSLMPELLLRDMTAEQVADLLAFLCSLK